jgi:hypothetical protein
MRPLHYCPTSAKPTRQPNLAIRPRSIRLPSQPSTAAAAAPWLAWVDLSIAHWMLGPARLLPERACHSQRQLRLGPALPVRQSKFPPPRRSLLQRSA